MQNLFIAGAGMDHRLVRAIRLSEVEYNKPLIIDLPGHGESQDPQAIVLNLIASF